MGKIEKLISVAKSLIKEDNKIYLAKLFKEILDTVSEFDKEDKAIEVSVIKSVLDWAVEENK